MRPLVVGDRWVTRADAPSAADDDDEERQLSSSGTRTPQRSSGDVDVGQKMTMSVDVRSDAPSSAEDDDEEVEEAMRCAGLVDPGMSDDG